MDAGLLILRLLLGVLLFAHATQKLFGWFQGPGQARAQALFEKLGVEPARAMVLIASMCELVAAALLVLGLLTPLGSAVAAGTMIVAGYSLVLLSGNVWNAAGGGEYPFVLGVVAIGIGFTGAGRYSLDHALAAPWAGGSEGQVLAIGFLVIVAAAAASVPPVLAARRSRDRREHAQDTHVTGRGRA